MSRSRKSRCVLIAPDSFKESLSAPEVAAAIAHGVRAEGLRAEECPVADGGEGTMNVLLAALGGAAQVAPTVDPLGRPTAAAWGLLADGRTGIVEAAQAVGLALVAPAERDAELASSAGAGRLVVAAARSGVQRILVAVGGTASTDGGLGAVTAIEASRGLAGVELVVLCDVDIPFELAAPLFAPQKGANIDAVARLTGRLDGLSGEWSRDPRGVRMTGAGGGLAGGLWACLGAELRPGSEYVLNALGFDERLARADAVVIGEGRLDEQSLLGKAGGAIVQRARAQGVPVHAIVGSVTPSQKLDRLELCSVRIAGTSDELTRAGRALARTVVAGSS